MRIYILLGITGLVVWLPAAVTSGHVVNRRWADRPVDYTGSHDPGRSLHDALADSVDQTYTDFQQGLTSIKDSSLNACFLFDLDPNLDLEKEDKNDIMKSQEPRSVENEADFRKFTNRVGPYIANMCKRSKVFWLVSEPLRNDVTDVPLTPDSGRPLARYVRPPRVRTAAIPRSQPRTPPRPASRHRSPPRPANARRSNRIAAPPPVSEYKAQRRSHSVPAPPPPPASNSNRAESRPQRIHVTKTFPEAPQQPRIRATFRVPPPPPRGN